MSVVDISPDDPYDWSIDRVIQELCNNPAPAWSRSTVPPRLPDPALLEQALRENDIDGDVLLSIDMQILKDDLGIKSLGQRQTILKAIKYFRQRSQKYQEQEQDQPSHPAAHLAPSFGVREGSLLPRLQSHVGGLPSLSPDSRHLGSWLEDSIATPSTRFDSYGTPVNPHLGNTKPAIFFQDTGSRFGDHAHVLFTRDQGKTLPDPDPSRSRGGEELSEADKPKIISHGGGLGIDVAQSNLPATETDDRTAAADTAGSVELVAEDDSKVQRLSIKMQASTQRTPRYNIEGGRKRIAPTFVSHISKDKLHPKLGAHSKDIIGRSAEVESQQDFFFLGLDRFGVDDVFYPQEPSDADTQISMAGIDCTRGQRKFVAGRIMAFLRQSTMNLPDSKAVVRIPYPRSILPNDESPQLFTMYLPGLKPTVHDTAHWPALASNLSHKRLKRPIHQTLVKKTEEENEKVAVQSSFDDTQTVEHPNHDAEYDYLLAKYPPKGEEEDVLVLYGESGDEGEYEDDTWAEIEQEQEDNEKNKQNGVMSKEEVMLAMDEAIAEMQVLWREKKLTKVQMKGFRRWCKAVREGRRQSEFDNAQFWITRFSGTLEKMREAIVKDVWHRPADVKHQCQSLEESVFQREEYRYYAGVLTESTPPIRPSVDVLEKRRAAERSALPEGEEILESDSEVSLGDFVVEDSSDAETVEYNAAPPRTGGVTVAEAGDGGGMDPDVDVMSDVDPNRLPGVVASPERLHSLPAEMDVMNEESEDDIISPSARRTRRRYLTVDTEGEAEADPRSSPPVQESDEVDRKSVSSSDISLNDLAAQDSDLDALPQLPKSRFSEYGRNEFEPVDLTLTSETSAIEITENASTTDFDVHTPDLNPPNASPVAIQRLKLKPPKEELLTPQNARSLRLVLHHNTKTSQTSDGSSLPQLHDVPELQNLDWDILEDRACNRRILAKAIYNLGDVEVSQLQEFLQTLSDRGKILEDSLHAEILLISSPGERRKGVPVKDRKVVRRLVLLFASYVNEKNLMEEDVISQAALDKSFTDLPDASAKFEDTLRLAVGYYLSAFQATPTKPTTKKTAKRARMQNEPDDSTDLFTQDSDNDFFDDADDDLQAAGPPSTIKKRKRTVVQSQDALSQQQSDRIRVEEQERRKEILTKRMQAMDTSGGDDPAAHAITFTDPIIFLDPHIGQRVKPHQVEGIQFMWRELITDPKKQGCLLAHTMGLGKTMQVISILVTIAQSSQSPDPKIRNQVPIAMQEPKALILCPPSLIDNWYDELIMWRPNEAVLGNLRKVTSNEKLPHRLREIGAWSDNGGVLIIGYETFRALIQNKKGKLNDEDHKRLERELLESPNIIIADEAHKMKNSTSGIAQVAKRFKSISRVALTGSPLANNLEEYHTMIDWIAPGYLGDLVQFRAKYSEPILAGLWSDSAPSDKRMALRKLHVLKRDLDPKINRADISAIAKDMPQKTEFYITVPLTHPQKKAYNVYVDHLLGTNESGKQENAKLWDWLAVLSLLLNHPSCFMTKLQDRKYKAANENPGGSGAKAGKTTDDVEGDAMPSDVVLADIGLSEEMIEQEMKIFQKLEDSDTLDEAKHSYRSLMVHHIVQESLKMEDKVLIFSHSIPTLNYLEVMLSPLCKVSRIDGTTKMAKRQEATKEFNRKSSKAKVFLISMKAGGLGLNLQGANRVIIYDFGFNPTWEEQSIGRAYRLGQAKSVYVYRFKAGGTFEEVVNNKAVFKSQLFARVVDKKNPMRQASKTVTDYIFPVRDVEGQDIDQYLGKDPDVLDSVIKNKSSWIRSIDLTETFHREEYEELTPEEVKEAENDYAEAQLWRNNRTEWNRREVLKQTSRFLFNPAASGNTATSRPAVEASMTAPTVVSSVAAPEGANQSFPHSNAPQGRPGPASTQLPGRSSTSEAPLRLSSQSTPHARSIGISHPSNLTSISRPETQNNPQQTEATLLDSRTPKVLQSIRRHAIVATSEHPPDSLQPYSFTPRFPSEEPISRPSQLDGSSDELPTRRNVSRERKGGAPGKSQFSRASSDECRQQ